MTDAQILAVVPASAFSIVAVITASLYNSARLTDMRIYTSAQIADAVGLLRAEAQTNLAQSQVAHATTQLAIGELQHLIERNHSETLSRFADVERRLSALEAERKPA